MGRLRSPLLLAIANYKDTNITLAKAYSSKNGQMLVELILKDYRCDGPSDDPFAGQRFLANSSNQTRFLGGGMWLVDAGDYDNDGRSERVFSIDDYNAGGYKLFYDGFRKSVTFQFHYH